MASSSALYDLIHSLSQSEKRYFKLFANQHTTHKNQGYLLLFNALEKLPEYDEKRILQQLNFKGSTSLFSANKNYLYNLILKSLRSFHAEGSVFIRLKNLLIDTSILINRGLKKQAEKRLKQANKLALNYHNNLSALEISILERKLLRRFKSKKIKTIFYNKQQEARNQLEQFEKYLDILKLYEQVIIQHEISQNPGKELSGFDKQMEEFSKWRTAGKLSFHALQSYHALFAWHAKLKNNHMLALRHKKAMIIAYEENPQMINEYQEDYINFLYNYLNTCYQLGMMDEFITTLKKMEQVKPKNFKLESLLFQNRYALQFISLIDAQEYKKAILLVPVIDVGLNKYKNNLTKSFYFAFRYNIATVFLLSKNHEKALTQVNKIINAPKQEELQDIQAVTHLLKLIIHYELAHSSLADYLITSTIRFLKKIKSYTPFAKILINGIKQVLYIENSEARQVFQEMLTAFHKLGIDRKGYEEFFRWLEDKLEKD